MKPASKLLKSLLFTTSLATIATSACYASADEAAGSATGEVASVTTEAPSLPVFAPTDEVHKLIVSTCYSLDKRSTRLQSASDDVKKTAQAVAYAKWELEHLLSLIEGVRNQIRANPDPRYALLPMMQYDETQGIFSRHDYDKVIERFTLSLLLSEFIGDAKFEMGVDGYYEYLKSHILMYKDFASKATLTLFLPFRFMDDLQSMTRTEVPPKQKEEKSYDAQLLTALPLIADAKQLLSDKYKQLHTQLTNDSPEIKAQLAIINSGITWSYMSAYDKVKSELAALKISYAETLDAERRAEEERQIAITTAEAAAKSAAAEAAAGVAAAALDAKLKAEAAATEAKAKAAAAVAAASGGPNPS